MRKRKHVLSPHGTAWPRTLDWWVDYGSAYIFHMFAKLIMAFQEASREFIVETTLWRRLYPWSAVGRADRLWFESPHAHPPEPVLFPACSMALSSHFPLQGLHFLTKWLTPTPLSSLQPHLRSLWDRGRAHAGSGWICLTAHIAFISWSGTYLSCAHVSSLKVGTLQGREVADATAPVPAGRGDTAPCKATSKPSRLLQRTRRAPLPQPVLVLRQHIHVGIINFISFISWQKPEWFLRWMALSPAWPSWCYAAGFLLLWAKQPLVQREETWNPEFS